LVGATFTNPVLGLGADPFVVVKDGRYHYIQSRLDATGLTLRSAGTLPGLRDAPATTIWTGGDQGSPPCDWWAPELHEIDGRCYVYVAADDGDNVNHRTYVLEAAAVDGPYEFRGELRLPGDRWAIDATVFAVPGGGRYVVWSGWEGAADGRQDLYLARLASPTEVTGDRVRISTPELGWERSAGDLGVLVNEGPAVLQRDGMIYLTYSGSGCWTPDYAIGLLTARASDDLLDPASWVKSPEPLLRRNDAAGVYGTGHNSFFTSPDGTETWTLFHAVRDEAGSCGPDREAYAQPVSFAPDGTPVLGPALPRDHRLPLPAGDVPR
jgi:GH43 family beta-xylosidase